MSVTLLSALKYAAAIILGLALFCSDKTFAQDGKKANPALYPKLRTAAFSYTREELHLPPSTNPDMPYGVIMDERIENGVYTLVAWENGETSMYLSSGGGWIGAGEHEIPNMAARKLVSEASKYNMLMAAKTDKNTLPAQVGDINFYLLTDAGLHTGSAKRDDLVRDLTEPPHRQPFYNLYIEAQKTIAAIRKQVELKNND